MVSDPEVNRRLQQFVCVRLDWDQMQKYRGRFPEMTQGNQVLLDPRGEPIPGVDSRGKRYAIGEFVALLDQVLARHPPDPQRKDDLRLDWFWWDPKAYGLPGHFGAEAIARLDRKPILTVSGPIPAWLAEPRFLRRHLRQFIWQRGPEGEARLSVRMLEPEERELATIALAGATPASVSEALDRAWLEYMRVRPMVARGYIDNPHGNWLKAVMERAYEEELAVRREALAGTLRPPGRDESP